MREDTSADLPDQLPVRSMGSGTRVRGTTRMTAYASVLTDRPLGVGSSHRATAIWCS